MTSLQASAIRRCLRLQRIAQRYATIDGVRQMSRWTERLYALPGDVRLERVHRNGLIHEWLLLHSGSSYRTIFHIHGGGFVFPLYNPSRVTTAYFAKAAGARAILVDYRLAPEYPFPAALVDCVDTYRWLIHEAGVKPEDVVFTGESAGGNLVVTTMLALRDAGEPLPARAVAICPVFEFEGRGTFHQQDDAMVLASFAMLQFNAYRGGADPRTPLLSPLYADLRGLPPILIQVGSDELLRYGAEAFHERALQHGVSASLHIWPGMWHFWHLFVPWLPEARQAMSEIAEFVNS